MARFIVIWKYSQKETDLRFFLVVVFYSLASSTVFVVVAAESPFENGVKLLRHSSKL
jgi:hypothetical protein